MTVSLGDWYHQFHGRKSDHLSILPCAGLQCHNGSTWHTVTLAHGLRVYTCKQCGLVKSVNTVKRGDGNGRAR